MGAWSRLQKMFGPGPSAEIQAAEAASGMDAARIFSPGQAPNPLDGYSRTPRAHDYATGYNIAARPRRNERVAFDTLRGLVEAYDVAQMCIWHRIDSVRSLDWNLVAADGVEGDVSQWVEIGKACLDKPDRSLPFRSWIAKYLYDVLAFDAGALYRIRNNAGQAIGLEVVDGTTIAPLLDYWGRTPRADKPGGEQPPAFVQFANGLPFNWLTTDDLIYVPFRPVSNSPYGRSPLETIMLNANADLRFQAYFMQRFTEGNIPEAFATAPDTWTPDQIEEFQQAWDAMMLGDQAVKSQIKWIPGGTGISWSNEKDFDDAFSLFLMRKTAAAYHVTPADLGFTEDVNRSTGDTQIDVQFRIGDLPLIQHVQGILTSFLQDDLHLPLKFAFDTGQEKEDRLATAQADAIYIQNGVVSASTVAERVYGISEPDGIPVPRFIFSTRAGPIPLSALYAVAGPVDPETGAPVPGAALPHKPFTPIEGVAPQKLPDTQPLAVQEYPADNPQPAPAVAPVAKEAGAGISVGTGIVGDPMLDEDDEEPVVKAAELASFRRFSKGRRKAGVWRDFTFTAHDDLTAHRLNQAGRVAVRKAAGEIVAAGLCVQASDTGRVLMLQRALDPTDPAAGSWEFPGGCLEVDEVPQDAAFREWAEETGLTLPQGALTGGWESANGLYVGFVYTIPAESDLPILDGRAVGVNPDDPDGDATEAIAWWDPTLLVDNPVVRSELAADMLAVLDQLAGSGDPDAQPPAEVVAKSTDPRWTAHPARHVEDALAAAHAGPVQAALAGSVTREQLRAVVAAYVAAQPDA